MYGDGHAMVSSGERYGLSERGTTSSVERYGHSGRKVRPFWEKGTPFLGERSILATVCVRANDLSRPRKRPFALAQTTVCVSANDLLRLRKSIQ